MTQTWNSRATNRRWNNEDPLFIVQSERTRLVRHFLYLYCVSDGFGNDFYSSGTASKFWRNFASEVRVQIRIISYILHKALLKTHFGIIWSNVIKTVLNCWFVCYYVAESIIWNFVRITPDQTYNIFLSLYILLGFMKTGSELPNCVERL